MLKKFTNKKGFTLMEMLIVVAIIAILVAIAIPTFNNTLNKAHVATDAANIRAEYAEAMAEYLNTADTITADITKTVALTGDNTAGVQIAGTETGDKYTWNKGQTATIKVTTTGAVTITIA